MVSTIIDRWSRRKNRAPEPEPDDDDFLRLREAQKSIVLRLAHASEETRRAANRAARMVRSKESR